MHRPRLPAGDGGIGMILVIGIVVFVAGLTATAAVIATNGLGQSRERIHFEQSLASAEAGIDFTLGHLQYAFDQSGSDYAVPRASAGAPTAACNTTVLEPSAGGLNLNDPDDERTYIGSEFARILATSPECVLHTSTGDVLIVKPPSGATTQYGRIYAKGWSPSRTDPRAAARTIKIEYVFMPFKPKHAILTGGSLLLRSSSTDVTGVDDDASPLAGVHTNGTLTTDGIPKVSGPVSYSATSSPTTTGFAQGASTQPKVRMPQVSAYSFYKTARSQDKEAMTQWWDLCHELVGGVMTGVIRPWAAPADDNSAPGDPCTGTPVIQTGGSFRGWTYQRNTNTWEAGSVQSGTYFVDKSNVDGAANSTVENLTVIASADNAAVYLPDSSSFSCTNKQYGNITWTHMNINAPAFKNLFFMADSDLSTRPNFRAGSVSPLGAVSGMYIAGDQVNVWTSSSYMVGSVMAADQCSPETSDVLGQVDSDEVQGQTVYFDPNGDSPFSTIIGTTLWLELIGM